jgi:hypothetical protein
LLHKEMLPMPVAMLDCVPEQASSEAMPALRILVLARAACEDGVGRAELARDLSFAGGAGVARHAPEAELAELVRAGLVAENKSRFRATERGVSELGQALGGKLTLKSWADLRDHRLVAKSLGLERDSAARIKSLSRPDQLRAEILAQHFGFRVRGAASASRLRSELALIALGRAFGNAAAGPVRSGLSAKASRLLAGQLLHKPRDVGTDSRLITLLAAEVVGSAKPDADALRLALLRRYASDGATCALDLASAKSPRKARPPKLGVKTQAVAQLVPPVEAPNVVPVPLPVLPPAANRPGIEGFAAAVNSSAAGVSEGWPGNRKALISRVWQAIEAAHPAWGLSAIEFKAMLAEAHRTGHLALATADLKDKGQLRELADSAITYKNTVWHLVRVQDA